MGDKAGSGAGRARRNAALSQGLGRPSGARRSSQQRSADTRRARGLPTNPTLATSIVARQQMQSRLAGNLSALTRSGRQQATRFINDDPPSTLTITGNGTRTRFNFTGSDRGSRGGRIFNYRSDGGSSFSVITTGPPGDSNAVVRIGT